jgi:Haemolymph juvenile hormone binding protein (JHBP)
LNIPPIDPYKIDNAEADHSSGNSNFNLQSSLKNAELRGFIDGAKITRVATKFDKIFQMKIEAKLAKAEIVGDYKMNGKILVLPIKGVGFANITMEDVTGLINIKGEYFDKNGDTFAKITSLTFSLTPKHASFLFSDIFKGDKVLSDTINKFMNDNWLLVINTLLPGYEEKLGERFRVMANNVFTTVPMRKIFIE